jgi:hypothetical protein
VERLSIFSIIIALIAGMIGCAPTSIEIRDWYDLNAIRNNLGGDYILMNNLNSTTAGYTELASETANDSKGWEPIGTSDETSEEQFTGRLNGQGYEIKDLFINRPDEDYVGLFTHISWTRYIDNVGVVENVGVVNADVTGFAQVGILVGHNEGLVNNSYSSGSVTGDSRVGGLVGWNQATLSNSYSTCSVTGDSRVGGLVGDNWYYRGILSNSYSAGRVTGSTQVGGLVGVNFYGNVTRSYSTGRVTGSSQVGGLVGYNKATVSNSFWDRVTSGMEESDGGTGRTTAQMMDIATFSDAAWDIITIAHGETISAYTWNIVDDETYPFLSWQSAP